MKKGIILVGGGGHCKSCIDVIELQGLYNIEGILDLPERVGQEVMGYTIMGTDQELSMLAQKGFLFLITAGQIRNYQLRISLYEQITRNLCQTPAIISPLAYVSKHSIIGSGTIIMHGAKVNAGAVIGENCIINTNAIVEHDVKIGNHCHISTNSVVNGGSIIGDMTFLGSCAVTQEYANIPQGSFIKANSIIKR